MKLSIIWPFNVPTPWVFLFSEREMYLSVLGTVLCATLCDCRWQTFSQVMPEFVNQNSRLNFFNAPDWSATRWAEQTTPVAGAIAEQVLNRTIRKSSDAIIISIEACWKRFVAKTTDNVPKNKTVRKMTLKSAQTTKLRNTKSPGEE